MAGWDADRIQLKQQIASEGIAPVIRVLKDLLPTQGEAYEDVLLLESRQNEANRNRLRNLLSDEELRRVYAQIRQDLMDLLDRLTQADFDPESSAQGTVPSHSQGSILYRIPDQMQIGAWTECLVRIAFDANKLVEHIDLDEDVQIDEIRISDVMRVELIDPDDDPPFSIRPIHQAEQFVDRDTFTEWMFRVKPLREGTFPLLLKVSVIEIVLGKERLRQLVLTEEVMITAEQPRSRGGQMRTAGTFTFGGTDADHTGSAPPAPKTVTPDRSVPPPASSTGRRSFRYILRSLTLVVVAVGGLFGILYGLNPAEGAWLTTHYLEGHTEAYQEYAQRFPQSSHTEEAYWQIASLEQKDEEYLDYLSRYPQGKFTDKALRTMQKREVLPAALEREDLPQVRDLRELANATRDWNQLKEKARTVEEAQELLNDYRRKYPDSYYERDARILKDRLEKGDLDMSGLQQGERQQPSESEPNRQGFAPQQDTLLWEKVRESGQDELLREYLEKYPKGAFADQAQRIMEIRTEREALQKAQKEPVNPGSSTIRVRPATELLKEELRLIQPKEPEALIRQLDEKLPANSPKRQELNAFRQRLARIREAEKTGNISASEAQQQREALRKRLQAWVTEL